MLFFKKYKNRMIVTLIAIILIVIIGVTNSERLKLTAIESFLGNVFTPVQKFMFSIGRNVSDFFASIKNISE